MIPHYLNLIIYRCAKSIRSDHISDQIGHFVIGSDRKHISKFEYRIGSERNMMGLEKNRSDRFDRTCSDLFEQIFLARTPIPGNNSVKNSLSGKKVLSCGMGHAKSVVI